MWQKIWMYDMDLTGGGKAGSVERTIRATGLTAVFSCGSEDVAKDLDV